MGDLKAPGPDGMPALFYKKYWHIVGEKVTQEVLKVLKGGEMPAGWNDATIVLIPKVKNPERIKDMRPISLCNVVYKIISKIIANRLKHKRRGGQSYAALKLDMSEAYDRVEWGFLKNLMIKMGFSRGWVNLVMKCVSSIRYQIKVNNEMTSMLLPERGLRQGDPLSPYLFLLCAEGFSAMFKKAEEQGKIQGIKISVRGPSVSHLLFADDSLLLVKADASNAREVDSILQRYARGSGKIINRDKSTVMFSKNTKTSQRREVMEALHLSNEAWNERYLGLPVYIGKSKSKAFGFVKERVWKKVQGWKEKLLSMKGKEILIKAVAQSIPLYTMACFDLTKTICDQISAIINRYWWSQADNDNKIHWLNWDILSLSKRYGGIGFRDLYAFNKAMLARQAWRLVQNPNSLCAQILAAKYFPDGNIFKAKQKPGISYTWRSVLKGVKLLKDGMIWRVGNGEKINIWEDPSIPSNVSRKPITPRGGNLLCKVSELIDPCTTDWDTTLINQSFCREDASNILKTNLSEDMED